MLNPKEVSNLANKYILKMNNKNTKKEGVKYVQS